MLGRLLLDILKLGASGAIAPKNNSETVDEITAEANVIALDEVNCLVKGRHGWFLANRYDQYLGRALVRYGEYGEIEHSFLSSLLSHGDSVIEVGANIGSHTVGLAKAVGPSGSVVAIEAQPAIFRALCANLALNGLQNVSPHACGCGKYRTTMTVPSIDYRTAALHNSGGVSLNSDSSGIPVPVIPLDELVVDIQRLRLIKIDVEGMEQDVLTGGAQLIAKHRPLLYVENDRLEKSKSLIEYLFSEGYELWWHIPKLFNPDNYFHVEENDFHNIASFNMYCQPKEGTPPLSIDNGELVKVIDADHHPLRH